MVHATKAHIAGADYNQLLCSSAGAGASESGSIYSRSGRGEAYLTPLRAFPLWRVHGQSAEQFVSAHASDAGSCSGHGSWRGLLGERSCSDPEGGHPADYR